jgi:hypothetical protein
LACEELPLTKAGADKVPLGFGVIFLRGILLMESGEAESSRVLFPASLREVKLSPRINDWPLIWTSEHLRFLGIVVVSGSVSFFFKVFKVASSCLGIVAIGADAIDLEVVEFVFVD